MQISEETKINANSSSFAFLKDEPEIYSEEDLQKQCAMETNSEECTPFRR